MTGVGRNQVPICFAADSTASETLQRREERADISDNWVPRETLAPGYSLVGSGNPQPYRPERSSSGPRPVQQSASLPSITTARTDRMPRLQLASLQDFAASLPATGGTHCRPPDSRLAFLCPA